MSAPAGRWSLEVQTSKSGGVASDCLAACLTGDPHPCFRKGLTFVSVHDCFWTHAADVAVMNQVWPPRPSRTPLIPRPSPRGTLHPPSLSWAISPSTHCCSGRVVGTPPYLGGPTPPLGWFPVPGGPSPGVP